MSQAGARYFCDATDMALGRGLAILRSDVLHPGHEDLPGIVQETPDPEWIAAIGDRGLFVITRDKHIRRRPGELLAWKEGRLRGFVLTGAGQQSTWDSVRILARHWDAMDEITETRGDGPWMYAITNGTPREIDLS